MWGFQSCLADHWFHQSSKLRFGLLQTCLTKAITVPARYNLIDELINNSSILLDCQQTRSFISACHDVTRVTFLWAVNVSKITVFVERTSECLNNICAEKISTVRKFKDSEKNNSFCSIIEYKFEAQSTSKCKKRRKIDLKYKIWSCFWL